ncbi:MAG: LLM class flavin-dependent oxidoreductase [Thiotrichales bacterium]|nr:LLM class flavin-dependent oxidoreductase [Thiotrichales bacterium]
MSMLCSNHQPELGVMLHLTPEMHQTPTETYKTYTELLPKLEALGFKNAWITEHHFNEKSLTPSPLTLIGHFLAHTETLKVGASALLIGFHNPLEISEQIAVLQSLYPNRLLLGFAKGGPFEAQNAAFQADKDLSRARMNEALPAMMKLWNSKKPISHKGEHYQWQQIDLQPKVKLNSGQLFVATAEETTVNMAAQNRMGLMSAQFWGLDKIQQQIRLYKKHSPLPPSLMVARGLFIDDNSAVARQLALEHIVQFREEKAKLWGKEPGPMAKLTPEELLPMMLCGTPEEVRQKTLALIDLGVKHLALNPLTQNHQHRYEQLKRFQHDVWQPLMHQFYAA